jgi:hypothetical protein
LGSTASAGTGFGAPATGFGATGTTLAPYQPTKEQDQGGQVTLHSITAMQPHLNKSFEELRWEDYQAGRKGGTGAGATTTARGTWSFSLPSTVPFAISSSSSSPAQSPASFAHSSGDQPQPAPAKKFSASRPEFRFANQNRIHELMRCGICEVPMFEPMRAPCDHWFCKACIEEHLSKEQKCPKCSQELNASDIEADKTMDKLVSALEVFCLNQDCSWKGPRSSVAEHLARTCNSWPCPNVQYCKYHGTMTDVTSHMQKCFDKTNFKQLKSFVDKWYPNRPSSNQKPVT